MKVGMRIVYADGWSETFAEPHRISCDGFDWWTIYVAPERELVRVGIREVYPW